jgi:hypothetical protein
MSVVLFRGVARDPWAVQGMGCLWAGVAIVGVVLVMNGWLLFSGESMEPSLETFVRWSIPVGAPLALVLGWAAWRVTVTSRIDLVVTHETKDDGGRLTLRVGSKLVENGPFATNHGWDYVVGGRGTKLLYCDVSRDGELLVRFSTEIGSLVATPHGWPRAAPPMAQPAKHGGYVVSDMAELDGALAADVAQGAPSPARGRGQG